MLGTVRTRLRDATPPSVRNSVHRARSAGDRRFAASITSVHTTLPLVSFTYDDGPHPERTPAIAEALEAGRARGTFFVLASEAEREPEIVRALHKAGHEIALHGSEHRNLRACNIREARAIVHGGKRRLEAVLGAPVRLFRPPYGEQNRRSYALARADGLDVVVWNVNTRDCYAGTVDDYVDRAADKIDAGSIVLFHDGLAPADPRVVRVDEPEPADFDRAALARRMCELVDERGLTAVPVSELLHHGDARRAVWLG
jgi:peptidoglycan/xylan/chitin deacetylase (PgdA/CDA1 family)